MAAKLHELLAVMNDAAQAANSILSETSTTFSKRPDHFKGQTKTVSFFDEARAGENLSETKEHVTTVYDKLDHTARVVGRYWDALLQLEETNQHARADLVIGGDTLAKDVPATFLLGMETRLKELRAVLMQAPTLAPELSWTVDETAGQGVYVSPAQVNFKGEKQRMHKVVYDATKEHPAQIETWTEDKPVARIEAVHRSTMLTPAAKSAMLERCDALIRAVKKARQRANTVEASSRKIAKGMFDYITAG